MYPVFVPLSWNSISFIHEIRYEIYTGVSAVVCFGRDVLQRCPFFIPEKAAVISGGVLTLSLSILFIAECICKDILQQYYQILSGAETAAGNHLTDYASAVVQSILDNVSGIIFMVVIPIFIYVLCVRFFPSRFTHRRRTGKIKEGRIRRIQKKASADNEDKKNSLR